MPFTRISTHLHCRSHPASPTHIWCLQCSSARGQAYCHTADGSAAYFGKIASDVLCACLGIPWTCQGQSVHQISHIGLDALVVSRALTFCPDAIAEQIRPGLQASSLSQRSPQMEGKVLSFALLWMANCLNQGLPSSGSACTCPGPGE